MRAVFLCIVAFFCSWAYGQTITTEDAAGVSVIEVITTDPILGEPTTQIIQTLTATTAVATTAPGQGPVGQPAPTGVATATVYTYTTTDANGVTTGIVDTFTPTYYQSQQSPTPTTGTILNYSSWLSMVGTNTAASSSQQASGATIKYMSGGTYGVLLAVLSSIVGGTWMVLL